MPASTESPGSKKASPHPYATALCVLLGFSALIAICSGRPASMPAIAMGSPLLLYLERTVALFAGGLLFIVVLVEAWRGNLPVEISGRGLKYERFKNETAQALDSLLKAVAEERAARGAEIEKALESQPSQE